ncbi:MAG: hypothetical protein QM770_10395 [Tepidisphaeraceae bacterium]
MRSVVAIIFVGLSTTIGCQSAPSPAPASRAVRPASAALAFTPPVTMANPPLDLAREDRADVAYVGYDSPTITYSWVHQDDRFRFTNGGGSGWDVPSYFERRSVSTTIGTRVR